jgi:two-component system OmpR family sensor kinase
MRSLASRLVVIGVVQMLLLAITAVVIFIAEGPHEPARPEDYLVPSLIQRLEDSASDQAALDGELASLRAHRIEASIYDADRQLVATNVDPPLAIPVRRGPRGRPPGFPGQGFGGPGGPGPGGSGFGGPGPGEPGPGGPGDMRLPPREGGPDGPPPDERRGPRIILLDEGGPHRMLLRVQVHGGPGFMIARGVNADPPGLTGPILVLIGGFTILVLGALITARWILRPIDRLTETADALGNGNLSARSKLERSDEIGVLGNRIDEMADRIEALLVAEKELLANVAHELRTPLARIGVALDLAGEGDSEAARAALSEIAVDVTELEAIVDDILTLGAPRVAGTLPLRKVVVEPRSIADASASRMLQRHPERPFTVTVASDLPAIDVDPVLFRRVIDNLLENAHKYSPDRSTPIELTVTRDADRMCFAVKDRGIGISAEDLPRVFTPFFRGDRSRSRETGGVGLGLTLAKRIVEAHQGTIEVASEVGNGTTVRVRVPGIR